MSLKNPIENPRIIVVQKLYGYYLNKESTITFPKNKYKKFIKDVVNGTIERENLIDDLMKKELDEKDFNKNTEFMLKLMVMAATYEFMFMHKIPVKVVITEYLKVSDFFVDNKKTKFLNAILDKISKKSRISSWYIHKI